VILLDQSGAAAKESKLIPPLRNLAPFVEHFWAQQTVLGPIATSWRVVPEPNPNVVFVVSRADGTCIRTRCCLVGPRSRFCDVGMADRVFTCGVRLRPGVIPLLTGFPAWDFTDRSVQVEEVFGARGRSLMNNLNESGSAIQAFRSLAGFLGRELAGRECALPLFQSRCSRVEEMAVRAGLPIRTLHSRMMQHVGLSPKRLLRIERLHRVLTHCQPGSVPWAQLALICGFADQAHMIREFQDLLGESPTAWSSRSGLPICSGQHNRFQPNLPEEA
jgi:AraC-like DNA-binding protein